MFRLLLLTLVLFSGQGYSQTILVDRIISVYDADTFRVDILNWPDIIGKNMSIRVNGVDAAEIRGKCEGEKQLARQARDFTKHMLETADSIELRDIQRGKYFRIIADVYADGVSLSDSLIETGLARPYRGGKRQPWC
ncbi:thermonuclease family protein [Marinomonas epiphytica]